MEKADNKGKSLDFIFMVGGFSESPYLKAEIKNKFEETNVQVSSKLI
jgi:hypothetical protein